MFCLYFHLCHILWVKRFPRNNLLHDLYFIMQENFMVKLIVEVLSVYNFINKSIGSMFLGHISVRGKMSELI